MKTVKPTINSVIRKSFIIRESGRSTDYISPSFGFGCLYDCTYCYLKRHVPDKQVDIASNVNQIVTEINNHAMWLPPKAANQTDAVYYTYDISCNEDFALHGKFHKWKYIFNFFKEHDKIKGSFATKYVNKDFLNYDCNNKIRIRFSLMPTKLSEILEPNTSSIPDRIKAIDEFIKAGYEVHINFSPIVVYDNWLKDYKELFEQVDKGVTNKDSVKAECIFLTHNENKHYYNLENNKSGESYLWTPDIQENKISQYGGDNIRYNYLLKEQFITRFKELHESIIPWNTIRYIF